MSTSHELTYAYDRLCFFNGTDVIYSKVYRNTSPIVVSEIFHGAKFIEAHTWGIAGTDKTTYIALLGWRDKWCIRASLDCGEIRQLLVNAITPPIPESDVVRQHPGMSQYIGKVQASIQCVLADGSVWNWDMDRNESDNHSEHQTTHVVFSDLFTRIEGLPAVKKILWNDIRHYNFDIPKQPRFLDAENRICEIATINRIVGTNQPFEQLPLNVTYTVVGAHHWGDDAQYCVATQSPSHIAFVLVAGQLHPLYPDQSEMVPPELAKREDISQCAIFYDTLFDSCHFYAVTQTKQLIVYLRTYHWVKTLENAHFEIVDEQNFICATAQNMVDKVFLFGTQIQPMVYCRTPENTFFNLFAEQPSVMGAAEIPGHILYQPRISQAIGSLPMQHNNVATSKSIMYVIQPNQCVISMNFSAAGATVSTTEHRNAVAIAAGWDHLLVLHTDGTVSGELIGTPREHHDQHVVPAGLTSVVAISCGEWMSYALRSDGTVVAWGRNDQDQVMPANYLRDIASVHGGRHHALFLGQNGVVHHIGSRANNDADTYPLVRTGFHKIHSADICAVGLTETHRVIDIFDRDIIEVANDSNIVDVVATRGYYALQYTNGRVVILNRYALIIDDEDPVYTDPILLSGISSMYANGDVLICVGFDGRVYSLFSREQGGFDPIPLDLPTELRVQPWSTLTQVPDDYDADACHEANTLAQRLGAIKQTRAYMNAPHKPTF